MSHLHFLLQKEHHLKATSQRVMRRKAQLVTRHFSGCLIYFEIDGPILTKHILLMPSASMSIGGSKRNLLQPPLILHADCPTNLNLKSAHQVEVPALLTLL